MAQKRPRPERLDRTGQHRTAFDKNRIRILQSQSVCGICGKPVDKNLKQPDPLAPVVDHIIPVSKGGHPSDIENLQLAHRWCNRQKSDKIIDIRARFRDDEEVLQGKDNLPLHFDWSNYTGEDSRSG